jgi:predicted dehydrogenase
LENLINQIDLAYWGSGPISKFHVPAFRLAGFNLTKAFSRSESERLRKFGTDWNIPIAVDVKDFLTACEDSQAIAIVLETSVTPLAIEKILEYGKPVFIEKPGGLYAKDLEQFIKSNNSNKLFFAYNRRYYKASDYARNFLQKHGNAIIQANFPDQMRGFHQVRINGCHIIDFLQFLCGDLTICDAWGTTKSTSNGFGIRLQSHKSHTILLTFNWAAPENVSIKIFAEGKSLIFNSFESMSEYVEMEIVEPTVSFPLRKYLPKEISNISELPMNNTKPGFLNQAFAFRNFVVTGNFLDSDCDLESAIKTLKIIDQIEKLLSS